MLYFGRFLWVSVMSINVQYDLLYLFIHLELASSCLQSNFLPVNASTSSKILSNWLSRYSVDIGTFAARSAYSKHETAMYSGGYIRQSSESMLQSSVNKVK